MTAPGTGEQPPSAALQFDRADYEKQDAKPLGCVACKRPLTDAYYEVNGQIVCGDCRAKLQGTMTGGSGAARFFKALAFGLGAGFVGSVIWYAIVRLTGYELGLIAIVVGLLVGAAVRKGSGGRGGWLYQGLAILLTYISIVSTYIPPILASMKEQQAAAQVQNADGTAAAPAEADLPSGVRVIQKCVTGVIVFGLAFALPVLAGFENIVGILIIGFALYEAWKINKRAVLRITGPYPLSAASAPPGAPGPA